MSHSSPGPDRGSRRLSRALACLALAPLFAVAACGPADTDPAAPDGESAGAPSGAGQVGAAEQPPDSPPASETAAGTARSAEAQLAALAVKGRAPKTGYDRTGFGWRQDTDHNGCDTRNDVLRRDLVGIAVQAGAPCVVMTGSLHDPYSGQAIGFDRAHSRVDIDHVVALSDAWQSGAQQLDEQRRVALANDPLNVLAVSSTLNRQKSDGDAATWLPPAKGYRCEYAARQIAVKAKYGLWVKPAERSALARVLSRCPSQPAFDQPVAWPAPDAHDYPTAKPSRREKARSTSGAGGSQGGGSGTGSGSRGGSESGGGSGSGDSAGYANCTAAREAGAAPLHRGDPGYSSKLDRDGDGTACE
ncbi:excalibur calcium-binding domain-containing protein [Brevibacterium sp. BRM-1]|uniref:excalibur calcium-binding domain-containing protein n=1 Tax=Brevibacterium sp. BRM-1 TaxID=2999062 RepID=UPI002280E94F|nr:excalibur calcium-binding domain-containing protein [Brevibacterium sp. BRM-1]WAL40236.1 excalibur calcium-binding domain-containing protein [Brevibacterium sp. BRM-1]